MVAATMCAAMIIALDAFTSWNTLVLQYDSGDGKRWVILGADGCCVTGKGGRITVGYYDAEDTERSGGAGTWKTGRPLDTGRSRPGLKCIFLYQTIYSLWWANNWSVAGVSWTSWTTQMQRPEPPRLVVSYSLPITIFGGLAILLIAPDIYARLRGRARVVDGKCVQCGYDIRVNSGRCPECGAALNDDRRDVGF